jgi:hypothetical protein
VRKEAGIGVRGVKGVDAGGGGGGGGALVGGEAVVGCEVADGSAKYPDEDEFVEGASRLLLERGLRSASSIALFFPFAFVLAPNPTFSATSPSFALQVGALRKPISFECARPCPCLFPVSSKGADESQRERTMSADWSANWVRG